MLFAPEEVDTAAIRAAKALYYGSISLIGEPSRSATVHAVALARDAGLRLAMEQAQIVKLSDDELRFLTGSADPRVARERLWHERPDVLVVTRGVEGCVCFTRTQALDMPGVQVEAVDSTGAGDGFVARPLHGLVRACGAIADEGRLREICRFACAVGALATTSRGAIPALPTRARRAIHRRTDASGSVERQGRRAGRWNRLADGELT